MPELSHRVVISSAIMSFSCSISYVQQRGQTIALMLDNMGEEISSDRILALCVKFASEQAFQGPKVCSQGQCKAGSQPKVQCALAGNRKIAKSPFHQFDTGSADLTGTCMCNLSTIQKELENNRTRAARTHLPSCPEKHKTESQCNVPNTSRTG